MEGLRTSSSSSVPFVRDLIEEQNLLFLLLTETWLREHLDAEVNFPEYTIYRTDRNRAKRNRGRNSGGVAIYLSNSVGSSPEVLLEYSSGVIEALCLKIKSLNLVVCVLYRPPDDSSGGNRSTSDQFSQLLDRLSTVLESQSTTTPNILIAGDFNLPHTSWPTCEPKSGAAADEKRMIDFLSNFCSKHFLVQLVDLPTHRAGNTLDLIFINNPDLFPFQATEPSSPISSHYVVTSECMLSYSSEQPTYAPQIASGFETVNLFSEKTNWDVIKETLAAVDWTRLLDENSVTELIQKFSRICKDTVLPNAPKRKKKHRRSRIPRDRRVLMRK